MPSLSAIPYDDVGVYPCRAEEEAKALLKKFFENEVAEDEANDNDAESVLAEDGWSATITNFRRDGSVDMTTWRIGSIDGVGEEILARL